MNLLRLYTSIQHQPFNIHEFLFTSSIYNCKLKMEAKKSLLLVLLSELKDSDDEKPTCGKTRL